VVRSPKTSASSCSHRDAPRLRRRVARFTRKSDLTRNAPPHTPKTSSEDDNTRKVYPLEERCHGQRRSRSSRRQAENHDTDAAGDAHANPKPAGTKPAGGKPDATGPEKPNEDAQAATGASTPSGTAPTPPASAGPVDPETKAMTDQVARLRLAVAEYANEDTG